MSPFLLPAGRGALLKSSYGHWGPPSLGPGSQNWVSAGGGGRLGKDLLTAARELLGCTAGAARGEAGAWAGSLKIGQTAKWTLWGS